MAKVRTVRMLVASTIATLIVFWAGWMAAVLVWSILDQARPAESIVVLGAAQYDGRPSPVLRARLDHAVELWNHRLATIVILTGGRGNGDTTSEAAVGRRYVRRHGVPEGAILLENEGRTTRESLQAVSRILKDRGMKSAILVSDPFHMLRLWILSRRFGFTAYTSPTKTSPISPNREARWRYMLGESVKAPMTFLFENTK
ncbi:MAG TPA: YdcF family protein [Gemmatimonadaceae bacterium]|nr:YdcF family protein [Gemmatimonadaceae bacterium]